MTALEQPKAPPTQRVSDGLLNTILRDLEIDPTSGSVAPKEGEKLALDLRDTRAAVADTQTALAARDARIAELDEALAQMKDQFVVACRDWGSERERADRLEAQLQAARAAGTREEGLTEAADALCNAAVALTFGKYGDHQLARHLEHYAKLIRARLTAPAEPTADTGEKG